MLSEMKNAILHAAEGIDVDRALLEKMFVQETLASDVLIPGRRSKATTFGPADLWNIRRKKKPVRISGIGYDRSL